MSDKSKTERTTRRRPPATSQAQSATQEETVDMKTRAKSNTPERARSLPVLVPEVHVHRIPLPSIQTAYVPVPHVHVPVPDAMRSRLPDPATNRLLWYGGLAGLAVLDVIAWPVAGVVAAGTYVAERTAKATMHREMVAANAAEGAESATHQA